MGILVRKGEASECVHWLDLCLGPPERRVRGGRSRRGVTVCPGSVVVVLGSARQKLRGEVKLADDTRVNIYFIGEARETRPERLRT